MCAQQTATRQALPRAGRDTSRARTHSWAAAGTLPRAQPWSLTRDEADGRAPRPAVARMAQDMSSCVPPSAFARPGSLGPARALQRGRHEPIPPNALADHDFRPSEVVQRHERASNSDHPTGPNHFGASTARNPVRHSIDAAIDAAIDRPHVGRNCSNLVGCPPKRVPPTPPTPTHQTSAPATGRSPPQPIRHQVPVRRLITSSGLPRS